MINPKFRNKRYHCYSLQKNERNTMNREQDASLLLAGAQETRSIAG